MAITRLFGLITALGKKFFPESQGPQRLPRDLESLPEEEQIEALEEFARDAATLEGGAESLDPFLASAEGDPLATARRLADELGLSEEVKKEFEPEEQRIGGPATATEGPQDPASVVNAPRDLESLVQIASGIALDGVPIRGEIKTTAVGSIL